MIAYTQVLTIQEENRWTTNQTIFNKTKGLAL
jgi:hypothetical protein